MQSFDIVINGGGIIGLSLACGLQDSSLCIAVLEEKQPDMRPPQVLPASRVSAINAASECLMRHIGVWQDIHQVRVSTYDKMEVWDGDSFGKITFCGKESGFTHLGHIIENSVMQQVFWKRAERLPNITLIIPAMIKKVVWGAKAAVIMLEDGRILSAKLVIAADGAHSWLRNHAGIPLTFWDYGHHALVATIRSEMPHLATARQMFHSDEILAFLPFSDPFLNSIVWSVNPLNVERLKELPPEKFNRQLATAFDMRLGNCFLESERLTFHLKGRYARNFAAHRLALVGDAGHTVHPLAGQGINLGFMDVAELIGELQRLRHQGKDIGQHLYLRRYERRRKYDAAVTLVSMQGFYELFDGNNSLKKLLRGIGLRLADSLPGVKSKLVRQAMGLNDLPEWLSNSYFC
ncbi:2-octaprenylphenol hydroxylase [Serratia symbiotica]|nr:2-octaprenylphenol hydroxylase [Serratia symbiotica]